MKYLADHPNAAVCWNCNAADLKQPGLEYNFNLVKNRLGATLHIHELDAGGYPYQQLFALLARNNYSGWALLEGAKPPADSVAGLTSQRKMFEQLLVGSVEKR